MILRARAAPAATIAPPVAQPPVTRRSWLGTDPSDNPVEWDPAWDGYARSSFHAPYISVIQGVLDSAVWDDLGIDRPTVWALVLPRGALGTYISGTSGVPHIGLAPRAITRCTRQYTLRFAVETTVLHEAGHAYLESMGLPAEDQHGTDVESVVEEATVHAHDWGDYRRMRAMLDQALPR